VSNDDVFLRRALERGGKLVAKGRAVSNEALRAALAGLEVLFRREGEDANDGFERVGDVFYRETGYLRPGKDCRLHSIETRADAWDAWIDAKLSAARAALSEQPTAAPEPDANECRIELVTAVHTLASHFENALGAFGDDVEARTKAKGDIAHACKVAARWNWNGPWARRPGLWAMQAREALELIATPMRADGTWNRDREACRQLAAEALGRYDDDADE
jgi:hypothetical protein